VDERNHPEKATDAALDYLTELHDRFGSWYLAAAAYNTGENRVGRIMREATGSERASSEEDYYRIWDQLPKETRDYVPLMIAAGRIAKDPAKSVLVPHVEEVKRLKGATRRRKAARAPQPLAQLPAETSTSTKS
jgi:membrane-bound lytic murein transglycosylase D